MNESHDQVDRDNNNMGESNMIKLKVINNLPYPYTLYLIPTTLYITELNTALWASLALDPTYLN